MFWLRVIVFGCKFWQQNRILIRESGWFIDTSSITARPGIQISLLFLCFLALLSSELVSFLVRLLLPNDGKWYFNLINLANKLINLANKLGTADPRERNISGILAGKELSGEGKVAIHGEDGECCLQTSEDLITKTQWTCLQRHKCETELGAGDWKRAKEFWFIRGGTSYHLKLFSDGMLSWMIRSSLFPVWGVVEGSGIGRKLSQGPLGTLPYWERCLARIHGNRLITQLYEYLPGLCKAGKSTCMMRARYSTLKSVSCDLGSLYSPVSSYSRVFFLELLWCGSWEPPVTERKVRGWGTWHFLWQVDWIQSSYMTPSHKPSMSVWFT